MFWALAVLFFQPPQISEDLLTQTDSTSICILASDGSQRNAEPAGSISESESNPKPQRAAPQASELSLDAQRVATRPSFRTRNDLAKLLGVAEERPTAPVQPANVKPEAETTSAGNAVNASFSSSSASPLPAGKAIPFLVARRARTPKLWYALAAAGHGAATFDAWTTRRAIESGRGHELNPLLRPFAKSNALYGAIQAGPALFDYLGWRMAKSPNRWPQRLWWMPQVAGTASSLWSGTHNLRVANRPAPSVP